MSNGPEHTIRLTADVIAGGITLTAIAGWLPPIAALCSIVWFAYQMIDTIQTERYKQWKSYKKWKSKHETLGS